MEDTHKNTLGSSKFSLTVHLTSWSMHCMELKCGILTVEIWSSCSKRQAVLCFCSCHGSLFSQVSVFQSWVIVSFYTKLCIGLYEGLTSRGNQFVSSCFEQIFIFLRILCIYFQREGKGGRKGGRETSVHGCLSRNPYWGPVLHPRHVPWLGIELMILWFTGWYSIHWVTPTRAQANIYFYKMRQNGHQI